jgi:hypothetical protein
MAGDYSMSVPSTDEQAATSSECSKPMIGCPKYVSKQTSANLLEDGHVESTLCCNRIFELLQRPYIIYIYYRPKQISNRTKVAGITVDLYLTTGQAGSQRMHADLGRKHVP